MTFRKIFGLAVLLLSSVWLRDHVCLAQTSDCNDGTRAKYKLLTGQPGLNYVLTWTATSFVLWNLEARVNEDLTSIGNSSFYLVDYLTPYFGREALTRSGQTTVTIVRAMLTALFPGGLWPSLKPMLQNRFWNPLVSWMKGEPTGGR